MKKILLPAIAVLGTIFFSCNQTATTASAGESDKAKKNMENSKAVAKMFESADFSKLGDYVANDVVDHSGPMGEVKGIDSLKKMFDMFSTMSKDAKNEIVKAVADEDYVFMWLKQSWTAAKDDPMMHMKAGDHGNMESVEVTKHNADGKITEHWGFMSMNDVMKMMPQGSMDMGMPKDSGNKMQKK